MPGSCCTWADRASYSKRKGLEKAIHQIEQAIKRPKMDQLGLDDAQKAISGLQDLLNRLQDQPPTGSDVFSECGERMRNPPSPHDTNADQSLALDDAENPLQLLARASDLQFSPTGLRHRPKSPPSLLAASSALPLENSNLADSSVKSFFVPAKASLDVGPDLDPVELGLVTFDESESLFSL